MVSLYVPIFRTGLDESLLKFLVLLKKILNGQNLTTKYQWYMTKNNLLTGENFCAFEQKVRSTGNKNMTTNKLVVSNV